MANIKSAIRRIKTTQRNTIRNKRYLSTIKTFTKKYLLFLDKYKNKEINNELIFKKLDLLYSKIDKASKVKVLHKNTAARKKSLLRMLLV
jgi:small subunit ribosomal protein S20